MRVFINSLRKFCHHLQTKWEFLRASLEVASMSIVVDQSVLHGDALAARKASGGADSLQPRRWSRQVASDIVGLGDALAVIAGAAVPAAVYAATGALQLPATSVLRVSLLAAIIVYICLRSWGMYPKDMMHDFPVRPGVLLAALAVAILAVLGVGLPFGQSEFVHAWVWAFVWISASFLLLMVNRTLANHVLARLTASGRFNMRLAVFGAGEIARRLHTHLANNKLGIALAGVFDDRRDEERLDSSGLEVTGKLDELLALGRSGQIDQIIIALPQAADRRIAQIARYLEQLPVSVHVVTHISSDLVDEGPAHKVSKLGPIGLLDVKSKPLADWAPMLKRLEDTVLSLAFLVATLPVFVLAAVLIKLESRGPVFFFQKRRGLNQKTIKVIKFRTMAVMEDGPDVRQATENDPRITRVGWWLRRTSLDELPQLINVLRGEMSIVGPRPHAIAHDEAWEQLMSHYINRHQVKPGITGLAQVRGFRGHVDGQSSIEQRVRNDLEYIAKWSFWLDMKIIARTVLAVLTGRNAH